MVKRKISPEVKARHIVIRRIIFALIILAVTIFLWVIPGSAYGLDGLTVIQQRVIAIAVFATLMWLLEVVPPWCTSVSLIVLLLLATSDQSFKFFKHGVFDGDVTIQQLGTLLSSREIMATFADPINMLFIGGFVLALATSKCGLDVKLAHLFLKPFGRKSDHVLLGFILITGIFSMFISNTATAAMMLAFLAPAFRALPEDGKGKAALALSIPVAANIGGMATPVGTPPNAIALKYLNDPNGLNLDIGFGQWMSFMLPLVFVLLILSWIFLKKIFPFKQKYLDLHFEGKMMRGYESKIVLITFLVTIGLWVTDKVTGVNANTVALIPVAIFCLTGVIRHNDLAKINWSVIWMVAGGFALGLAFNKSGLAELAIRSIPFGQWSPLVILLSSGLLCYLLSNFISNTATAALLMPILVVVGTGMSDVLFAIGGMETLLIGVAISASSAMLLPISTPPNALAYSTGLITQKNMLKIGAITGALSLTIGFGLLYVLGSTHLI